MIPYTLCVYIFRDLIKIFLLTAVALAGIMSFAGLLRPLTQHGLDGTQVVKMLAYFMPAMTTYSLPVAALFATTMVYGRFSADNELVAARAAGISHWMISLPAVVLGLVVATVSLAMLSYLVPLATLQVEKVIFSNIAGLVANKIERTHTIDFDQGDEKLTIWAGSAQVALPEAGRRDQVVRLNDVMIATYGHAQAGGRRPDQPVDFLVARSATAFITPENGQEPMKLNVLLENGSRFARDVTSRGQNIVEVSIATTQFGPWPLPSRVKEDTKFMTIGTLQHLLRQPEESQRLGRLLADFVREDMRIEYLKRVQKSLAQWSDRVTFEAGPEKYELVRADTAPTLDRDRLTLTSSSGKPDILFRQITPDGRGLSAQAIDAVVRAFPDFGEKTITVTVELRGAILTIGNEVTPRGGFDRSFVVPMPQEISELREKRVEDYLTPQSASGKIASQQQQRLFRDKVKQYNSILSEIQSRLSFALSCLVLVVVGCCLGLWFKSGNFLSAFAVSAVPALLCIVLIVSGQHTAENVPMNMAYKFHDPLKLGLSLIWSGNAVVGAIAAVLMWKLGRE